jgi:hypothetical protein
VGQGRFLVVFVWSAAIYFAAFVSPVFQARTSQETEKQEKAAK